MSYFFSLLFVVMVFWRPQEWLVPVLYGIPILDGIAILSIYSLIAEMQSGAIRVARMPQAYLLFGLWMAAMIE